jgi:hypothetical protein
MDWISVPFPMTNSIGAFPPDGVAVLSRLPAAKSAPAIPKRTKAATILFFI